MVGGIEGREIVAEDEDREKRVSRLNTRLLFGRENPSEENTDDKQNPIPMAAGNSPCAA